MKKTADKAADHSVSCGNVFEDIGFSPAEALELKVKAEILREIVRRMRQKHLTQAELAETLGIHQPDVSRLMKGRIARFSVGRLIQLAGKLDLDTQVTVIRRKISPDLKLKAKTSTVKKSVAISAGAKPKAWDLKRQPVAA